MAFTYRQIKDNAVLLEQIRNRFLAGRENGKTKKDLRLTIAQEFGICPRTLDTVLANTPTISAANNANPENTSTNTDPGALVPHPAPYSTSYSALPSHYNTVPVISATITPTPVTPPTVAYASTPLSGQQPTPAPQLPTPTVGPRKGIESILEEFIRNNAGKTWSDVQQEYRKLELHLEKYIDRVDLTARTGGKPLKQRTSSLYTLARMLRDLDKTNRQVNMVDGVFVRGVHDQTTTQDYLFQRLADGLTCDQRRGMTTVRIDESGTVVLKYLRGLGLNLDSVITTDAGRGYALRDVTYTNMTVKVHGRSSSVIRGGSTTVGGTDYTITLTQHELQALAKETKKAHDLLTAEGSRKTSYTTLLNSRVSSVVREKLTATLDKSAKEYARQAERYMDEHKYSCAVALADKAAELLPETYSMLARYVKSKAEEVEQQHKAMGITRQSETDGAYRQSPSGPSLFSRIGRWLKLA